MRTRGDQPFLALLPFAMMGAIALIDVMAGPDYGFLPLLTLGPAFASLSGGTRRVVTIGLLSLGLCGALAAYDGVLGTRHNTLTLATMIGVIIACVLAGRGRQRRERELANVRSIAEAAQHALLRPVPRRTSQVQVAVSYTSAVAEALIGGDLYEVTPSPHGVRAIIGDVQGKGLAAVETAATVVGAFREAAPEEADLQAVGAKLEKALNRLSNEEFVTAVLAQVGRDDTITLLNYGHPAPLILRAGGEVVWAEPATPCLPLGLTALGADPPEPHCLPFKPGDQILLYTDGVIEARDPGGAFYPLGDRTDHLHAPDPQDALERLRADLLDHVASPLHDDTAMLLLRRREATAPQTPKATLPT